MPKFGTLGITPGHGFNGSYVDVKVLIEHRVVLTIDKYELRPSCMQGGQLCMLTERKLETERVRARRAAA